MVNIIVGKSGSGKDTLLKELVARQTFEPMISTTSRPMREGEMEGREYFFVSKDKFLDMAQKGQFLEYRSYDTLVGGVKDTWYYGSAKLDKEKVAKHEYITVLDIQGAKDCIDYYGKDNCFVVMLEVSDKIREERAIQRGSFDKCEWDRRKADDEIKFSDEATRGVVNLYLKNDCDIQELAYRFEDALVEYTIYTDKKQTDEHIICIMEQNYSRNEPPIPTFKAYTQSAYDSMVQAEEEMVKFLEKNEKNFEKNEKKKQGREL